MLILWVFSLVIFAEKIHGDYNSQSISNISLNDNKVLKFEEAINSTTSSDVDTTAHNIFNDPLLFQQNSTEIQDIFTNSGVEIDPNSSYKRTKGKPKTTPNLDSNIPSSILDGVIPEPDLLDDFEDRTPPESSYFPDLLDNIQPKPICDILKKTSEEVSKLNEQSELNTVGDGFVLKSGFVLLRSQIERLIGEAIDRVERLRNTHLQLIMPQFSIILNNDTDYVLNILKVQFGYAASVASDMLKNYIGGEGTKDELVAILKRIDFKGTALERLCPFRYILQTRTCSLKPYREIDGYCNNLNHPFWGASGAPVQRFLNPAFGDGINAPRRSFDGAELPNPRKISTTVLHTEISDHGSFTHAMMTFGQFLDHEFALGSSPTGFDMGDIKCCKPENKDHPQCFAVEIPRDDYFFSRYNSTCMEVVRSVPAVSVDCHLGPRQTNNEITSYIDGSQVYGSNTDIQKKLREFKGGLLKSQPNPTNPSLKRLLPVTAKPSSEACANIKSKFKCFASGDKRTNENSLLMSIHTIFMREHNRIAEELGKLNSHWDDEKIYEESKRILGAEIQHIAYSQYLPHVLGHDQVRRYNLDVSSTVNFSNESSVNAVSHFTGYCESVDATVDQGFITAAFRFGHSLINTEMFRMTRLQLSYSLIRLRNDFFHPLHIYKDQFPQGIDPLLRGMVNQMAQNMDNNIAEDVKNHLFELDHEKFGMDLMVLNIMRAREHGVPGYNAWRSWCGFNKFSTWDDLDGYLLPRAINDMRKVYKHPDDIDLFVGGICEKAEQGSLIGPTFSCIIGNQFRRFRFGDRYWYENANIPGIITHAFTKEQLNELKKVSLSRMLCDNSDTIHSIQIDPFKRPSSKNPIQKCRLFAAIDLSFWKEN